MFALVSHQIPRLFCIIKKPRFSGLKTLTRQKYPNEIPYVYKPLAAEADTIRWNDQTREAWRARDGNEYWRHDIYM